MREQRQQVTSRFSTITPLIGRGGAISGLPCDRVSERRLTNGSAAPPPPPPPPPQQLKPLIDFPGVSLLFNH
ncbi:hypothetical protein JOB18_018763 [Solea senegalensis]|uniref:Uncharacterized protein n=1 Tax=Solea senegalensis TaxID=28829 RepID=A0AAV6SNH5_SOLSE|nr:hypothetical protein JOB18_018763 [Solea senegalensis]